MNIQPLARSTDPLSSHMAAERARSFVGSHQKKITFALEVISQGTAKDISEVTGLTIEQVDRRVSELYRTSVINIAQADGMDYIRDGFRVLEYPMSDEEREVRISMYGELIEFYRKNENFYLARKALVCRDGLIKCRSYAQIRKMETERGLV